MVPAGRMTTTSRLTLTTLAALLALAGCGGGGGSPGVGARGPAAPVPGPVAQDPLPQPPTPAPTENPSLLGEAFSTYWNKCATPRTGLDASGKAYPDRQGSLQDELNFLRAWSHQYYLWYNEIPNTYRMSDFNNPIDYFNVLKTTALTPSGKQKDRYHFTYPTAEWEAMNTAGIDLGYGITWSRSSSTAPRAWLVTVVEPGSPAAGAGLRRGDRLVEVDGVDFVNASDQSSVDKINGALFPTTQGEAHRLVLERGGQRYAADVTATEVSSAAVKNARVIETASGKVGYLTFDTHNAVSEKQLIDAFTMFRDAGVSDLVLDMRYNGGGLLYIASQLAYMVAGPESDGKVFHRPLYNDKTAVQPAIPFRSTAYGFKSPDPVKAGTPLPYLGLKRVTVLSTKGTCSASEAVVNGLRGVDVEVNLIGAQTCGKPFGFTPVPNCGTTYFSIEFQGVNAKGFGDYADGLAPTCAVADDLSREVGDPQEGLLAAALKYQESGTCPVPASRARSVPMELVRPQVKESAILLPER